MEHWQLVRCHHWALFAMEMKVNLIIIQLLMICPSIVIIATKDKEDEGDDNDDDNGHDGCLMTAINNFMAMTITMTSEWLIEVLWLLVELCEVRGGIVCIINDVGSHDMATPTATMVRVGVQWGGDGGMINSSSNDHYNSATMMRGSIVHRSVVIIFVLCNILWWEGMGQ